jgi:hypothetical protein
MPVPDFSPGEVLTAAAMDSIGLWLVKKQAISASPNVTSVTVSNAFSADYISYKILYLGGVSAAGNTFTFQLAGATGSNYDTQLVYSGYGSGGTAGAGQSNAGIWTYAGINSAQGNCVDIDIYQPFLARHTYFTSNFWALDSGTGRAQGVHKLATSYTGFTLGSGTGFNSGQILVYGYRN